MPGLNQKQILFPDLGLGCTWFDVENFVIVLHADLIFSF